MEFKTNISRENQCISRTKSITILSTDGDKAQIDGLALENDSGGFTQTGNVKGLRSNNLEKICIVLDYQPGDILEYRPDENKEENSKN